MLIRIEAFGRVLHIEYSLVNADGPDPHDDAPVHIATPDRIYADDHDRESTRDFVGFVGREAGPWTRTPPPPR